METRFVEVTNGFNFGKFMVGRFDADEWSRKSVIEGEHGMTRPMLSLRGWTRDNVIVWDLQTGEGAIFYPGGYASADLNTKHKIWVCPMYEPFLTWLYQQDLSDLSLLPEVVELTEEQAPSDMYGYRRTGGDGG